MIPYERLESWRAKCTALQHHFHKVMSREIVREHGVMLLLGSMRAEERLAAFLLNLSQRFTARGYSRAGIQSAHDARGNRQLPRAETGNRQPRLLAIPGGRPDRVQQKHIRILDPEGLRSIVSGQGGAAA